MQRRQVWILNGVLAVFAVFIALRLAAEWRHGNERYRTLEERVHAAGVAPIVPVAEQASGTGSDIVARNLFSPDRNNNRAQATQSAPPVPIVMGTMRLADGYEALMSEGGAPGAARFRRIKKGEQIGGYTVAEIRDEAVVVEYGGQKSEVNVYQSAQSVARTVSPPVSAPAASGPLAGPVVESAAAPPAGTAAPANTFPA